jgi:hypothetical protein
LLTTLRYIAPVAAAAALLIVTQFHTSPAAADEPANNGLLGGLVGAVTTVTETALPVQPETPPASDAPSPQTAPAPAAITVAVIPTALQPVTDPVLNVAAPLIGPAQPLLDVAQPVADSAAPLVDAVEPAISPVAAPVIQAAQPVLTAVQPVLDATKPVVEAAVPVFVAVVAPVANAAAPVAQAAVDPVVEATLPVVDQVVEMAVEVTEPVVDTVAPVLEAVAPEAPVIAAPLPQPSAEQPQAPLPPAGSLRGRAALPGVTPAITHSGPDGIAAAPALTTLSHADATSQSDSAAGPQAPRMAGPAPVITIPTAAFEVLPAPAANMFESLGRDAIASRVNVLVDEALDAAPSVQELLSSAAAAPDSLLALVASSTQAPRFDRSGPLVAALPLWGLAFAFLLLLSGAFKAGQPRPAYTALFIPPR